MSYIRKSTILEQLFGPDVPLWRKLLTLVAFPVWVPISASILVFTGLFALVVIALDAVFVVLDASLRE